MAVQATGSGLLNIPQAPALFLKQQVLPPPPATGGVGVVEQPRPRGGCLVAATEFIPADSPGLAPVLALQALWLAQRSACPALLGAAVPAVSHTGAPGATSKLL